MSNELEVYRDPALEKVLAMWNDQEQLATIRQCYAPKLNDTEFKIFVGMGISLGLNPFLREIWAVKYSSDAGAQIFIGRDGYRKIISRNQNYKIHLKSAVYENDEFWVDMVKVEVHHKPALKNPGKLMGAYCLVYMKDREKPYYQYVELGEYNTNQSLWKSKPRTMIEKVAECQAIRMADMSTASTYAPEEVDDRMLQDFPDSKADKLNKRISQSKTIEGEKVNLETGEVTQGENAPSPQQEAQQEATQPQLADPNAPQYTFEELRDKLVNASTLDALTEAASLISSMGFSDEKRGELKADYNKSFKRLKGLA